MTPEDVKALVEAGIAGADVAVQGSGNKFGIRVVSTNLDKNIYPLQTYTPDEWQRANRLGIA